MIISEEVYFDQGIDEISDFLDHHGVRGQKWGIRKQRRAENFVKVGKGMGRPGERIRSATNVGPIDLVKGRGFRGAAARKGARQKKAFKGKLTGRKVLTRVAAVRYQDVIPTSQSKKNTSAAVGASIAGYILVHQGTKLVKKAITSAA
jgi:hypothetical protein